MATSPVPGADAGSEPLHPPQSPGWLAEQKTLQATPRGVTPYRPKTSTASDALTYLKKRSERQQARKVVDGCKGEFDGAVAAAREAHAPADAIADALRQQIKGVARVLDFDAAADDDMGNAADKEGALKLNYTSTPRSGYKSTASIALDFLNHRTAAIQAAKEAAEEAAKVSTFKTALGDVQAQAEEKGVPRQLIQEALEKTLEDFQATP